MKSSAMDILVITPRTKIYDMLEAYPELEIVLIESAPEFSKLKNPLLRNTIARITNISQASSIAGLNVETLVNRLREKAGQQDISLMDDAGSKYVLNRPEWFSNEKIAGTLDINEMLNRNEQPVYEVLSSVKKIETGEIIEIKAAFLPAPLLDKSISLGYRHWVDKKSEKEYIVYLSKE